jgi:non-heme chloroperoxidase
MPYLKAGDGTTLFYRDWGAGQPMVFLSSWGLRSDMWQYQLAPLAENGIRCIAYDRRGHGRSDDPGRGYDADTLADDLAALIEALDLRDVTLVGHSMGGAEIVRYLTRHGQHRISRIALVAAWLPFQLKTADNPAGIDAPAAEELRNVWKTDFPRWLVENAPPFFGDGLPDCDTSPAQRDWLIRMLAGTSLQALVECNRAIVETDFRPEMRDITVPTLIIHGDQDVSTPLEFTGKRSADLITNSQLIVYENAPHGLFLTHQRRLTDDLLAFVKS